MDRPKKSSIVAVVGAGPAGLMAADAMAKAGIGVTVYERMPSAGRKFLLAGRGGLNLTHSEAFPHFLARYGVNAGRLRTALERFSPSDVRAWSEALGQETFVGSSGRVFPKAFKASPLLRAWLRRLDGAGVAFRFRHRWIGWRGDALEFDTSEGVVTTRTDAVVLALGGASWPRLGSDGSWLQTLAQAGIAVSPLRPANCGVLVPWSDLFRDRFEGEPLKPVELSFRGQSVRGEAMITRQGLEGGAIYALSSALRDANAADGRAVLHLALRPDISSEELATRLSAPRGKQSLSNFLRKSAGLSPVAIGLLYETSRDLRALNSGELAQLINAVPLRVDGVSALDRAISTAGGVAFDDVDTAFMLHKRPGVFVAGEMLDWDAPTGGYLLQASFSTGMAAAQGVLAWLDGQAKRGQVDGEPVNNE